MKHGISVLISTKDRPTQLITCVESIVKGTFTFFEIIIVDQTHGEINKKSIERKLKKISSKISYFSSNQKGLSKARNEALRYAKYEISAFIDDDCIADLNWLKDTQRFFLKNRDAAGVFGRVLPFQPEQHRGKYSISTFQKKQKFKTQNPKILHYQELGLGNNMAFKTEVIKKSSGFKEWLGAGSISINGSDDGEFIYRLLRKKIFLYYEPAITIFHNRWLTAREEQRVQIEYACGEAAFAFFYFLKADLNILFIFKNRWQGTFLPLIKELAKIPRRLNKSSLYNKLHIFYLLTRFMCSYMRGFSVAIYRVIFFGV
jgi:glycosyltransferase involved in cell wall biosynthesis